MFNPNVAVLSEEIKLDSIQGDFRSKAVSCIKYSLRNAIKISILII